MASANGHSASARTGGKTSLDTSRSNASMASQQPSARESRYSERAAARAGRRSRSVSPSKIDAGSTGWRRESQKLRFGASTPPTVRVLTPARPPPPARALRPTPRFSAAQLLGRSRDVCLSIRERRARHRGGLLPSWDVAFHTSHLPWHVPDSGHVDKPRFSTQRELLAHRAEQMLPDPSYASPLQTERRGERERACARACMWDTHAHARRQRDACRHLCSSCAR